MRRPGPRPSFFSLYKPLSEDTVRELNDLRGETISDLGEWIVALNELPVPQQQTNDTKSVGYNVATSSELVHSYVQKSQFYAKKMDELIIQYEAKEKQIMENNNSINSSIKCVVCQKDATGRDANTGKTFCSKKCQKHFY